MANRKYGEQYSNIYFKRLEKLRPKVYIQGKNAWEGLKYNGEVAKHSPKVLDVGNNAVSWVVGTVYREMKLKPSILEEITASHFGAPPPPPKKYTDPDTDQIMLEDESGRINLVGELLKNLTAGLVTGCVMAVMGSELASGDFEVLDFRFLEYAPQKPLPEPSDNKPKYLALVSGLGIRGSLYEGYHLQLLKEYLCGELIEEHEFESSIVQLIIAGDSLEADDELDFGTSNTTIEGSASFSSAFVPVAAQDEAKLKKEKKTLYKYNSSQFHPEPMVHLDNYVADIASSLPVTIMPGATDLANITLPQQPIHHSLFPECNKLNNNLRPNTDDGKDFPAFQSVTNPHWQLMDSGLKVLGTSGQPITDMCKYISNTEIDRIDLLNQTLRWQHVAPTAPDTLAAYSFYEKDPFVIKETPHVYFAGNQPSFSTALVEGKDENEDMVKVRLVCVPKFNQTAEIVLIDINHPDLHTINLKLS